MTRLAYRLWLSGIDKWQLRWHSVVIRYVDMPHRAPHRQMPGGRRNGLITSCQEVDDRSQARPVGVQLCYMSCYMPDGAADGAIHCEPVRLERRFAERFAKSC